jgi:regulatory protein
MDKSKIPQLDRAALWEFALKRMGGRAYSTGEMRQKLARRALRPEDVDDVLAQLKEYGYLDDKRFAESFAAARLENQQLGRNRVVNDLRRRRVSPVLAEGSVRKVYRDVNESALIEQWIRGKYRSVPKESLFQNEKDLAAAYRRLLRAGFRSSDVIPALKRFAKDPELLDSFEPPEEPGDDP